ncbi:MAG TPA: FtsX-like permease family protein [Pyrinomonadaceae bacterium]|jgi:ABC-type lipoprotein release transport system permease subunit|nr:FtsX-like permease family protein [Pyrinomonadaceae bacterium]
MKTTTLLKRNLIYYRRTNTAVVCGVAIAVAVLAGALLVGDSVRASLRSLVLGRLGRTAYVVSASNFFREELAGQFGAHTEFASASFDGACPLVVFEGVLIDEASGRRAGSVQVYGVDERFWQFQGADAARRTLGEREAFVSAGLASELGAHAGSEVLLRIEKPSAIPVESLHGRKEDVGRTMRLTVRETLAAGDLGEFSLRPQQGAVRAVFVPLRRVQKDAEQEGRVNTILLSTKTGDATTEADSAAQSAAITRILRETFTLADLGVKVRSLDAPHALSLETESAVVGDALRRHAEETAQGVCLGASAIYSYLANSIRAGDRQIPYSLVTAIDAESFAALQREAGQTPPSQVQEPAESSANQSTPILLNDWAARDLGARVGDAVSLDYYVWRDEGRLETQGAKFRLTGVVPMRGLAADRELTPEYPGISGTESLSDWDPPFPLDLSLVRPQDEAYWKQFRTTPKAFIPLARGQELWQTRYGKLTSLRLYPEKDSSLEAARANFEQNLRGRIDPLAANFSLYAARNEGLKASRGATDFGEYFLYFSFFLVVSALMLAALFFKLGIEQRLREIGILQAVGFPAARLRALFLGEGLLLAALGSVVGLGGALLYGALMMYGLRTWWVAAVGTRSLALHVSPLSLALGGAGGIVAALACIWWTLRLLAPVSTRELLTGTIDAATTRRRRAGKKSEGKFSVPFAGRVMRGASTYLVVAVLCATLGVLLLLAAASKWVGGVPGFFGAGTLFLVALLCFQSAWLRRRRRRADGRATIHGRGWWPVVRLGFRNASHRPARSVLCIALIASAAFIIVAVDAFRRDPSEAATTDKKNGTGGYALLAESLLPLAHDPNDAAGREALNLSAQEETETLAGTTFTRFRLRPGDDASCLNLYQPREPRILAPAPGFIAENRFAFADSLAATDAERANPWLLLERHLPDGATPVIADANSLAYVLHRKLGEEIVLNEGTDQALRLRFVAALSDSLFQSELLMSERNFLRAFPEQEGYRFFLLDAAPGKSARVAALLESRLSDFGFDATSAGERLAEFHRVENTYLSTFQTLGGLGTILGTLGLATVLLRNVLERKRELALLRAVGYNARHLALMVVAENALLLFCGLLTGVLCALLAIAPAFYARGGRLPTASLAVLLALVVVAGLAASVVATVAALRSPLLPALRAE